MVGCTPRVVPGAAAHGGGRTTANKRWWPFRTFWSLMSLFLGSDRCLVCLPAFFCSTRQERIPVRRRLPTDDPRSDLGGVSVCVSVTKAATGSPSATRGLVTFLVKDSAQGVGTSSRPQEDSNSQKMKASDLHTCIETFFEVRENDGARTDKREREREREGERGGEKTRKKKGKRERKSLLVCKIIFSFLSVSLFLLPLRFFPQEWSTLR